MEKVLLNYLGEKLIDDLRAGAQLSSGLLGLANQVEIVDVLRKSISNEDFRWIRSMCDSKEDGAQQLALSLVRSIQYQREVRLYLEEMWHRNDLTFITRIVLQSQLLQYEDLQADLRTQIFQSILNNWDEWITEVKNWTGGVHNVLDYIQIRLGDSRFPRSKWWYYLCCAPASNDPIKARELVERFAQDSDPFMKSVAEELLRRLNSCARASSVINDSLEA